MTDIVHVKMIATYVKKKNKTKQNSKDKIFDHNWIYK